jgi:hypothetical protein
MLIERFCNVGLSSLSHRPHGHFFKSVVVDEPDDAAAIASAKQLVDGHDVELWQRDRKIAKFEQKQK